MHQDSNLFLLSTRLYLVLHWGWECFCIILNQIRQQLGFQLMQMNETISCNFTDLGLVLINILSSWQFCFFFLMAVAEMAYFTTYYRYSEIMWYLTFSPGDPMAPWGPGSPCRENTKGSEHFMWLMREKSNVRQPAHHWPEHLGCLAVREVQALLEVPEKRRKIWKVHYRYKDWWLYLFE